MTEAIATADDVTVTVLSTSRCNATVEIIFPIDVVRMPRRDGAVTFEEQEQKPSCP
jgi:hypothetical protein